MAVMRNRIRILGALLAAVLVGVDSRPARADLITKKTSKKTSKKTAKKTSKKVTKKTSKKVSKKTGTVVRIAEPGTVALVGAGMVVAGVAQKLGRRTKKRI